MFVPKWLIALVLLVLIGMVAWCVAVLRGRNPLPFPDNGSRIFAASSKEAKAAVVELLAQHGVHERFQVNTEGVARSIMWDGTIVNFSSPEVAAKLKSPAAGIGLVADDPPAAANAAAEFLRARGFHAQVVLDAEPGLPIAFVLTDALHGSVINFRKHVIHMPRPD
jgi:hypothetical protein